MIKLLLVTPDSDPFAEFSSALLKDNDVELSWAKSGRKALDMVSGESCDLVIADEKLGDMTGLELINKLLAVNPMINSAAVSPLPADAFHEVSEGLGVLTQLPSRPGKKDSEDLLGKLKKLKALTAGMALNTTGSRG